MRRLGISVSIIALVVLNSCTDYREEDPAVTFGVNTTELSFLTSGDSRSVTVSSGKKWDVPAMPQWISLQSITHSGISPYEWTASFSAASNEEYNREGRIVIKAGSETAEISVSQDGKKGRYVAVESVSVSPSELILTEGENSSLSLIFYPSDASNRDVTWKTSASSIATVSDNGRVDAVAEGTAMITVTTKDGNKTASCTVTVKAKVIPVTGISLNKTSLSMTEGDTQELIATVTPSNASDKSVIWSSNNTSVATVSSSGVVTAKAAGSTTITVTTNDGGKKATCSVTVSEAVIEAIDLGLSVKWGSFNLGANKPEEYGDYYAWGEIETKTGYSWSTYKWCNGSKVTLTKYNTDSSCGTVDNKTVLDSSDDVAHVVLGDKWRIPTNEEWRELRDNCTWTWTSQNGVNGYVVIASNGNRVFFPASGFRSNTILNNAGSFGYFWSSSLYTEEPYYARDVVFDTSTILINCLDDRFRGQSIRPVYGDPAKVAVTSVSLNKTSLSMTVGDTQTLTATVTPSNASDKSVTWTSSNTSVAMVSSSGVVTAKAAGSATITVTTTDGGKKATCTVTVQTQTVAVTGVSLNKTSMSLVIGGTEQLTATVSPSNATNKDVTWSSSNTNVATVDSNGNVSAIKVGTAIITVTTEDRGKTATCSVTVNPIAVTGVTLNQTSLTMTVGDTQTLTATVTPSNATDKSVAWSSNNTSVATVSSSGVVTAKAAGSATITVTTTDGGKKATCSVTVQAQKVSVTGVSLNKTSLSMTVGDTQTLTATVTPSNATDKSVTWSSSNTSVATVSSSGVVTAKAAGSATITVTTNDGGKKATCSVTVKAQTVAVTGVSLNMTSLSMTVGDTQTLTATVTPSNATDKSVTWSSSNTSVATVSSSGVVTAKAAGSATITVTTNDGGKKATCSVTVKAQTVAVTGVSLNKTSLSMTIGDTQTLTATVTPSNATDKSVTWSSSNTSVATVSTSGVVTAKAAGSATITVTTNDGGKKATCSVTVEKSSSGTLNGYNYVEMGDGLKWATMNVGASSEIDSGDYFAWGETETYYISLNPLVWKDGHSGYGYYYYEYFDTPNDRDTYITFNNSGGKTQLDASHDAATANWGSTWRMPTKAEFAALLNTSNYSWNWDSTRKGYIVTSKVSGYQGNSIFFPAAGYLGSSGSRYDYGVWGCYWSSSLGDDDAYAWHLAFKTDAVSPELSAYVGRCTGYPIRAVSK